MRVAFKKFRYMAELLQPMIPELKQRQLAAAKAFQAHLGRIQDTAVLLSTLDELDQEEPEKAKALRAFRRDLEHGRDVLVRGFLAGVDKGLCKNHFGFCWR